jgi:type I restriction enzyme S subunit
MATLPELVGTAGLFSDGDWVETKDQDPLGDVRLIQLADIGEGTFRNRSRRFLRSERAQEMQCTFLRPDDILIARMPDPLGRACMFPGDPRTSITAVDVAILRVDPAHVHPRWLMWAINAPQSRAAIATFEKGTTRKRISRKNLARVPIPLPPHSEQERIVAAIEAAFSRIDAGAAALGRIAPQNRRLQLSLLAAAFSGRLIRTTTHRHAKSDAVMLPSSDRADEALSFKLPEGWVVARLDSFAEVKLGRQRSPKNHYGPHMRPYLRAGNVTWDGLDLTDVKEMNFSPGELGTFRLRTGDILLSEASGSAKEVGKPAIWANEIPECCFQNTLLRVRTSEADPSYLLWFFKWLALSEAFAKRSRGVGIHHLGAAALATWLVPLPPRPQQEVIAAALDAEMPRIAAAATSVRVTTGRTAQVLRSSVLATAFAGGLVRQDSTDEPASALLHRIASDSFVSPSEHSTRRRSQHRTPKVATS